MLLHNAHTDFAFLLRRRNSVLLIGKLPFYFNSTETNKFFAKNKIIHDIKIG